MPWSREIILKGVIVLDINIIYFVNKNSDMIKEYMINHFSLSILALIISLVVWIPVGIYITKNEKIASRIMEISNICYCIPSLALFSVLITVPFLGLGRKSALFALVIYSMMPLVRSVYSGIKNVDKSVIEAARGMGMSNKHIFYEVQLPLAAPAVFGGFRTITVMIVSTASLATYIGEKNLGRLISQGLSRGNIEMVVVGAIMISLIAIILDNILALIERKISYKNKKQYT